MSGDKVCLYKQYQDGDPRGEKKNRTCLKCGKVFISENCGIRSCDKCSGENLSIRKEIVFKSHCSIEIHTDDNC